MAATVTATCMGGTRNMIPLRSTNKTKLATIWIARMSGRLGKERSRFSQMVSARVLMAPSSERPMRVYRYGVAKRSLTPA